jgi:mono/diheme cytochrome c family protein
MLRCWFIIAAASLSLCVAQRSSGGEASVALPAATASFLDQYCLDCHGEGAKKARVRLDRLPLKLTDPQNLAAWIKVLDKLDTGEMPPKDEEQPPRADVQETLAWLRPQLHAADLARQHAEGRVIKRRLNRVEYEETLHDLLAIEKPLRQLLPEDGAAAGFDNVGAALNTSSQLLERYLEAADVALKAAMLDDPRPETKTAKFRYIDEPTVIQSLARPSNSRMFAVDGDAYIMFSDYIPYGGGKLGQFRAPDAGRYRVRITAYGHMGPVTMRVYAGATHEVPNHLVGHYDLPADKPSVVEFVDEFPKGSTLTLLPYRLKLGGFVNQTREKLLQRVGMALQTVEIEGPLVPEWPPRRYRQLLGELDLAKGTLDDAEKVLRNFVPRAFRRPVTEAEVRPYVELVQSRLEQKYDFRSALRLGLQAVLCSPRFLFLEEQPGRLSDLALASRLSYFLWSSLPDEELLTLAGDQKLAQPEVLRAQVERMLSDARAERFVKNFTGQWLGLRQIDATTPDKVLYPEFDELLQVSMVSETELFFKELLQHDLSVTNFVDSDFSMLNGRLAQHYGIPGVEGQAFRRVALPPESHRGGVLTQGAILKVTANGTNTSPVLRGVWVFKNIIGQPVPPPPPNVPAVEPDIRGAVTIREQLAKHRQIAACASCHVKIDPAGFALENFDVVGGWRERYRSTAAGDPVKSSIAGVSVRYLLGRPVEAADQLADGRPFASIDELKKLLLADREQIARCLAEKLLTYATGAAPQFADRQAIADLIARSRAHDLGLRTLIHEVVQSPAFLYK